MSGQVPEEIVESGARAAFFEDDLGGHIKGKWTFDTIPDEGRENYRKMVRAVLLDAAPAICRAERERATKEARASANVIEDLEAQRDQAAQQERDRIERTLLDSPLGQIDWLRNAILNILGPGSGASDSTDWDDLLTIVSRRGDAAAAAQTLGYANNVGPEALSFRKTLLASLQEGGSGE